MRRFRKRKQYLLKVQSGNNKPGKDKLILNKVITMVEKSGRKPNSKNARNAFPTGLPKWLTYIAFLTALDLARWRMANLGFLLYYA